MQNCFPPVPPRPRHAGAQAPQPRPRAFAFALSQCLRPNPSPQMLATPAGNQGPCPTPPSLVLPLRCCLPLTPQYGVASGRDGRGRAFARGTPCWSHAGALCCGRTPRRLGATQTAGAPLELLPLAASSRLTSGGMGRAQPVDILSRQTQAVSGNVKPGRVRFTASPEP